MKSLKLTVGQAMAMIRQNVSGATIVTVDLDSDMDGKGKMRTTSNPYAGLGVVKRETLNGILCYNYGNAVNRLAAKEGKDERTAKPHPWGDMDEKRLFRIHRKTGEPYLSMKCENVKVHGFFRPDGTEVADADIRPFIPVKVKSSTQADLDGEVHAVDYKLANIRGIRFAGMSIEIIPPSQAVEPVAAPADEPATVDVSA